MIVGFDHDSPAVFQEIEDFLDRTASPFASISVLNAPNNTPLYERMKRDGRLVEDFRGFWHLTTNIIPKQLTSQELYIGQKDLFSKIYEPEHFEHRIIGWLKNVAYFPDFYSTKKKNLYRMVMILKIFRHFMFRVPPPVRTMFWHVLKASWRINHRLTSRAVSMLVQYWHYYDYSHKKSWQKAGLDE
jgi:hypothetical protein